MFRRFSVNFAVLSMFLDAIFIALALYAANLIRPFFNTLPFTQIIPQPVQLPFQLYPVFSFIWVAILVLFSIYDGRRNLYLTDEMTVLTLSAFLATIALGGTLYLSFREISRVLFVTFILLAYSLQVVWRLASKVMFRRRNQNGEYSQQRRVLIVGAGPVGRQVGDQIKHFNNLALKMVGYLDDDKSKQNEEKEIIGPLWAARTIIEENQIDDVVIALPRRAYEKVNSLVAEFHDLPVKVWVIPDYFHLALHKAKIEEFASIPMLDLRAPALNDYQRFIKRVFELLLTVLSLPIALILMGVITVAIRLEGPGPIIFRQQRVGENGTLFNMYKFRTMVPDAEMLRHLVEKFDEDGNLIHKSEDDPRVTKIGRFLRRTSLDELPQFINILKGEMSLVGPRPEIPYLVEKYEPWQRKRFAVPQGITGWWQVNGRSTKPMHLHTEDDIYYVQNYSLFLDIKILLKTILVILRGNGAY